MGRKQGAAPPYTKHNFSETTCYSLKLNGYMMQQNKGWPDYLVSEIPVMAPFGQYFNDVIHIHYSYFHTVLRSVQCFFLVLGTYTPNKHGVRAGISWRKRRCR